ncbi:Uncharacterised protein [Legionella maceachernii]|nr:hypothetical protein [Legionella maceachernii]SJZ84117.1 hypothetical protein SAMN02745128_01187 [Legionella maceachernii]SUO99301.1 Uncharacterised protein [Legionella maceachernii]
MSKRLVFALVFMSSIWCTGCAPIIIALVNDIDNLVYLEDKPHLHL